MVYVVEGEYGERGAVEQMNIQQMNKEQGGKQPTAEHMNKEQETRKYVRIGNPGLFYNLVCHPERSTLKGYLHERNSEGCSI